MSEVLEPKAAIDLAYENINRASQMLNERLKFIVSTAIFVVTIVGGVVGFLLYASVSELKSDVRRIVELEVAQILLSEENQFKVYRDGAEAFKTTFSSYVSRAGEIDESLKKLERFSEIAAGSVDDYFYAYIQLDEISEDASKHLDKDQRAVAWNAAEAIIAKGLSGSFSSDQLFNASQSASILEMNDQSHRLAALAVALTDALDYRLRVVREEMRTGVRYKLNGGLLIKENLSLDEVRRTAAEQLISSIPAIPNFNNHLYYSEIWNATNYSGDYQNVLAALEVDESSRGEAGFEMPSYPYAIMAQIALRIEGSVNERVKILFLKGLEKFKCESRASSWYLASKREFEDLNLRFDFNLDLTTRKSGSIGVIC